MRSGSLFILALIGVGVALFFASGKSRAIGFLSGSSTGVNGHPGSVANSRKPSGTSTVGKALVQVFSSLMPSPTEAVSNPDYWQTDVTGTDIQSYNTDLSVSQSYQLANSL